jgi:hypothetical protein
MSIRVGSPTVESSTLSVNDSMFLSDAYRGLKMTPTIPSIFTAISIGFAPIRPAIPPSPCRYP